MGGGRCASTATEIRSDHHPSIPSSAGAATKGDQASRSVYGKLPSAEDPAAAARVWTSNSATSQVME